jgi:hypothetical protein
VVSPELQLFVQAQDSRLWGEERSTLANTRNVDLHQAYAELQREVRAGTLRVRAGRQELVYGDERVIGPVNWSNTARAFDALQIRLQRGAWTGDVVGARLGEAVTSAPDPGASSNDDLLLGYNRLASPGGEHGLELYVMYRSTENRFFETTFGERIFASRGRLRLEHELALQRGRRARRDLSAYLLATQLHARLAGPLWLGAGMDVLSGDEPNDDTIHFFDTGRVFHTGHKFYGLMDVAELLAGNAGLYDGYGVLAAKSSSGIGSRLEAHVLRVQNPDVVASPTDSRRASLGTEIDAVVTAPVASRASLEVGGALFLPGARLEQSDRGQNAFWTYAQAILDF